MTVSPLINNVTEIKIKLHRKHTNRSWLEKIIKKKKKKKKHTVFVYEPYLRATKFGYCLIALNTQKCDELEV